MDKKTENIKKQKVITPSAKKATTPIVQKDLLRTMDSYFDQRIGWLIWVILGVTFLFMLLLFDSRVSLTGDDSFYIIRASDFIHSFKYPGFQGPLYPIILSLLVAVFGISLVPLKVFSMLLIIAFMYLFFVAFRKRIPSTLLVVVMVLMSINSFVLYYGSQTYNEAFYMFVQIMLVVVFFRSFIDNEQPVPFRQDIKRHLILAMSLLALTLTKNIGYASVFAVTGYFLIQGQWKNLAYSVASFIGVWILFQGVKYMFWHDGGLQFSTQGSGLMNKDYYNPQAGKEDLAGFFNRLLGNSNLYLSKHFMSILGLRKTEPNMSVNSLVTLLIYALSSASLFLTFKKNKYIFFSGLLTGAYLILTFIILQVKWDQSRLIIPAIPMLTMMIFSSLYYISDIQKFKLLQVSVPVLALFIFFQSLAVSAGAIKDNQAISGKYGGLTPDWKNYLKASEWAATNLPKNSIIACRKPSISFVYGNGRNFYGIMQLPSYNLDGFFNNWSKDESAYMLFNYSEFAGKKLTPELFSMLKTNMAALLFIGDTVLFADKVPGSETKPFTDEVKAAGFNYYSSANTVKLMIREGQVVKIYYPDSLLANLQNNGVTHLMTANLRRNSNVKDGFIINTVERYMAFIQEKFPDIFTKVSQVGDDNNEPATIFKIEYEKYGRTLKQPIGNK